MVGSVLLGLHDLGILELKFSVALLSFFKGVLLVHDRRRLLNNECVFGFLSGQCNSSFSFVCLDFGSENLLGRPLFGESG